MAKRTRDNLDLCDVSDAALAGVKREDLLALLRACADPCVYVTPWDGTAVMSPDHWERISATTLRCLQAVEMADLKGAK